MNYKLIEHIATGGFGKVEKVLGDDGVYYARKTFHLDTQMIQMGLEENAKKRFKQEARFQASISHPNVVNVIELFLDNEPPSFIMPLAESSLEKDQKSKMINATNFVGPIFDILSGLEEIHELEIFHRDLKPSNVLRFKKPDDTPYYAISDFGLISVKQRTGVTQLTSVSMQKSSDYYTAPEIVAKLRNASASSDVYSVGCIIHDFIGTKGRVPNMEINDDGPYKYIMSICTKFDPQKRFKSITALRDALGSIDPNVNIINTPSGLKILQYLEKDPATISESELDEIIEYLNNDVESLNERKYALLQIGLDHIDHIKTTNGLGRFSEIYCEFIRENGFQFDTCDALASRLNRLISGEDLTIQTEGIMALLHLGTNHNRWYVERMFVSKVNSSIDIKLASRLEVQFLMEDKAICAPLRHLVYSIGFSYDSLHPKLLTAVKKICNLK